MWWSWAYELRTQLFFSGRSRCCFCPCVRNMVLHWALAGGGKIDAAVGLSRRGAEGGTVLAWSFLYSACRLLFCSLMTVLPLGCCRWQMVSWQAAGWACRGLQQHPEGNTLLPCTLSRSMVEKRCRWQLVLIPVDLLWSSPCWGGTALKGGLWNGVKRRQWDAQTAFTLVIPCVYCSASDCWVLCFVLYNML